MKREDLKDKFREILEERLGLNESWTDGTYLHFLTRDKSAYAAGTMTLDDFEEINYDFLEEILGDLMKVFDGYNYGMFIRE